MYHTIEQLIEGSARKNKSLPAFSLKSGFRTKTYTYAQILDYVKRSTNFFKSLGVEKGDKIIVLSLNRPEYSTLILGAIWSGVTLVPIDYRTNAETISKFIAKTKPKAVFTSKIFESLFSHSQLPKVYFEDFFQELLKFETHPSVKVEMSDTAGILFTSGTTGEPKGTIISYKNVFASITNARAAFPLSRKLRIMSVLPLSHALEMFGGMMTAFTFGCHIHYIERINSVTIVAALIRYEIQAMAVVPQMLRLILQNIERKISDDKREKEWEKAHKIASHLPLKLRRKLFSEVHSQMGGNFQFFVCGSAPLETKIAKVWENMGVKILEGYGASETTGFVSSNNFKNNQIGTVGTIFPNMEVKLVDGGELWVKGDNIVEGYFENPEASSSTFVDGWFRTGDIVAIDGNGRITITGRDKFKIVLPDGKKVYPEDIEKKLNNHPQVIDSVVFGLKGDDGESVHAELIVKNAHKLKEIVETINSTLNPHEQIMGYGVFAEKDFPRTKTLKIDRAAVMEIVNGQSKDTNNKKEEKGENDALVRILRTISGKEDIAMHGNTVLATDLKLDSLKRIELLAFIEEELGVSVPEVEITPTTTIAALRSLVKNGKPVATGDGIVLSNYQFSNRAANIRVLIQDFITFPLANIVARMKYTHKENVKQIKTPQLLVFNHVGVYDVFQDLRAMPRQMRKKTAIAATRTLWTQNPRWMSWTIATVANCFPFVRAEEGNNAMRGNFERVGEVLDKGFNVFISPEANITKTGELLPFHTGVGYIAIEMEVPITLFKLVGYFELWPEDTKRKLNFFWPKKFGKAEIIVSEPIIFSKGTSYEEAAQILHQKMLDLK